MARIAGLIAGFAVSLSPALAFADVQTYYDKRGAFNSAAGSSAVVASFDDIDAGTDITGTTRDGLIFVGESVAGRLFVEKGNSTFTPAAEYMESGVPEPGKNRLYPTSGTNVLSPGGRELGAGPDPAIEHDIVQWIFRQPVSAVGFHVLFQSEDGACLTDVTLFGPEPAFEVIHESSVPCEGPVLGGRPGGSTFAGYIADTKIGAVRIEEHDHNNEFPDANIGADTIRVRGCDGRAVTHEGDDVRNTIEGTDLPDVINALGGNDGVVGRDGNDRLCGAAGDDEMAGNRGQDRLFGAGGDDDLFGLENGDFLFGGSGSDELVGHEGGDFLKGGPGSDNDKPMDGGPGEDEIRGGPGNDVLKGGPQNDDLSGGPGGNDKCFGGPGNHDRADNSCEHISGIELVGLL